MTQPIIPATPAAVGEDTRKINELVDRYVAVWNEPDPALRRQAITELWTQDGGYLTQTLETWGYNEIESRVTEVYEEFVATGNFVFKSSNNATGHHNAVKFNWEMVPISGGPVAGVGFDFFILEDDGRIKLDYQFIEI